MTSENKFLTCHIDGEEYIISHGNEPQLRDWSLHQDAFSLKHPEMSTHRIVKLIEILDKPIRDLCQEALRYNLSEATCWKIIPNNKVEKIRFRLNKILLHEKNEQLKGESNA